MLKIENLSVKFDQRHILKDVFLNVEKGKVVGLIGQNGCGKTTLLNTICGFVEKESGSVIFNNEDLFILSPYQRARKGIGRSFQHPGIFQEMTVEENIIIALERVKKFPWWWKFSAKFRKKADEIVDDVLREVDLLGHKKSLAGVLSGGQMRLLELSRLKVTGGSLLLIDEPTAGVSPSMKKILAKTIKGLAEDKSRSILIIEHDLKFLFEIVDYVVVLVEGSIFMQGKPDEIVKDKRLQEIYFGA